MDTLTSVVSDLKFSGVITGNKTITIQNTGGNGSSTFTLDGNSTSTYSGAIQVNSGATLAIGGTSMNFSNSTVNLSGTAKLSALQPGTIAGLTGSSSSQVIAGGANKTLTLAGNGNYTFDGAIVGNATFTPSLAKTGTGTQILTGNNTYIGTTTVSGGTLQFAKQVSLYSANNTLWTAANVKVASGGTLALNVGGAGEFTTANVTTLLANLGGANGTSSNGFAAGSKIAFDTTGGNFTVADVIANSTGTGGGAIGLVKLGSNTLTLTGNNTYSGNTTVNGGTLVLSNIFRAGQTGNYTLNEGTTLGITDGSNLGAAPSGVIFAGNSTLQFQGNSSAPIGTGRTMAIGSGMTATIDTNGFNDGFNAAFTGSGGTLAKIGSGTLTLNGTNTYTGATNVNAGTLQLTGSLAAGSTVNVGTAGTLAGNGTINGSATLTGSGVINLSGGTIAGTLGVTGGNWNGTGSVSGLVTSSSGTLVIGSGANLTANGGLNVTGGTISAGNSTSTVTGSVSYTSGSNSTFSGIIAGSGKTVTMNSTSATLTLAGANSYTGATTVTAGTLLVNGSTVAASAFSVNSGGTLGGNGTIGGSVTVNSGGFIAPGNSPGLLAVGSLTLNSGSTTAFEINGIATRGTDYDAINISVASGLTLNGTFTINFTNIAALSNTTNISLFGYTGTHTGDFSSMTSTGYYASGVGGWTHGVGDVWTLSSGGQTLTFSEVTGNLNVVPEPATWALLAFSLTTVMVLRRRRRD
ncbi:MAG: autotransporter-associated beta strand repeat-containing protein [Verrucomicrobiota bacterium]